MMVELGQRCAELRYEFNADRCVAFGTKLVQNHIRTDSCKLQKKKDSDDSTQQRNSNSKAKTRQYKTMEIEY